MKSESVCLKSDETKARSVINLCFSDFLDDLMTFSFLTVTLDVLSTCFYIEATRFILRYVMFLYEADKKCF